MKRTFTLFVAFLSFISAFATGPAVPSSNLQVPAANIDGDRLQIKFNKGSGGNRIVIMKEGSAVSSSPVNGTDYTASASFGSLASAFGVNDGYVVYRGNTTSDPTIVNITALRPATTYYISIYEFNGTGAATEYLLTPLTGSAATKSAPTTQAAIASITQVTGNKATLNLSGGNGDNRIVIARKGQSVSAVPQDLTNYSAGQSFGSGSAINTDNFVIYKGTSTTVNVTNLEPNTIYYFSVFAYNGSQAPVFLSPGMERSTTTNAGPTTPSGTISFTPPVEGNRMVLSFPAGTGKYQLIIGRKGQPVTAMPVNGETYTPSTVFGSGEVIEDGQFVLNTTNTDRVFTNLEPATMYYFRIYDYDVDANGNTYYLTSSYSEGNKSTASAPTTPVSDLHFENIAGTSVTIKYTANTSDYRMIIMKEGSAVDASPADLTRYNGNSIFTRGDQITPGNYVMNGGSNSSALNITGLTPGATYYATVFSFNGNNFPVYLRPGVSVSITLPNQPSTAATNFQTNTIEGNSFRAQWSGGDGARRIVIARKGAAVTAQPVDGATYTAADFMQGSEIEPGQFVVYDGEIRGCTIENLEAGATYHFAVFEYNIAGGAPDYLVTSSLAGTGTTVSAPTSPTNGIYADNIQDTKATIHFATGNGNSRLFLIRAGSPVDAEPQELQSYDYSTVYGTEPIGTGNYIVQRTNNNSPFTISSLSPNTHYYIAAFEFNGNTAPVYRRPAATYDFTTTGSTGVVAPAINASAASFDIPDGNKLSFSWNNGDGAKRIVVMRQGAAVDFSPADGTDYTANSAFGTGVNLGNGQYVVYNGTQNNAPVTNLSPSTVYYFAVFEYNGAAATARYLIAGALTANKSTAVTPVSGSTDVAGAANDLTLTLSWNAGPGNGRLIVMKEGSAVSGVPADLSEYPASPEFGDGAQIAAGEYVVYAGSGNTVTVTGLENHKTYYYKVFEYNGVDAPVYNTANAVSNNTMIASTLPLAWVYFTAKKESDAIRLEWGTAQEDHTSHFVVERSVGSGGFAAIATIMATGGPLQNDYSYIDRSHPAGVVSYRIKQVDIDNRFEYSKQVIVQGIEQEGSLKLYPNPAVTNVRVSLPAGMQQAMVKIYSLGGILVKTALVNNGELIFLRGLMHGMYQVVITNNSKQYTEKLVVQ